MELRRVPENAAPEMEFEASVFAPYVRPIAPVVLPPLRVEDRHEAGLGFLGRPLEQFPLERLFDLFLALFLGRLGRAGLVGIRLVLTGPVGCVDSRLARVRSCGFR